MSLTNKALFVIERNLTSGLTLASIAENCETSRFHLAHAFGESTGFSVMDYVRARRLTEAARALASGASNILDVALDACYSSHEAFSRAFKAQFGKTPEEVRKEKSVDGLSLVDAFRHMERKHTKINDPRIETTGELLFVGLSEVIAYRDTQKIAGQWQRFMSGPYEEIEHKNPSIPVGVTMQDEEGGMSYVCAAEVTRFGRFPRGLTKVTLGPSAYLVFEHQGHVTELDQTYAAIWDEWLPASGRKPADAPGLQRHNPTFDPHTGNGGVTIWIPVVA
jgi:AraC family transcriptional regulator